MIDKNKIIKDFYNHCYKYDDYCNGCEYKETADCMAHYIIDKINEEQRRKEDDLK